jgi:spore germination protein PC
LEGTLNIGLTPKSGEGLLDDLSIGDQPVQFSSNAKDNNINHSPDNPATNPICEPVIQRVEHYLQTDLINDIRQIEQKFDFPLDDNYRIFIIDDIRKQIPYRVTQLIDTLGENPKQTGLPNGSQSLEEYLFETIQIEITTGIEKFIVNLKNGGIKG